MSATGRKRTAEEVSSEDESPRKSSRKDVFYMLKDSKATLHDKQFALSEFLVELQAKLQTKFATQAVVVSDQDPPPVMQPQGPRPPASQAQARQDWDEASKEAAIEKVARVRSIPKIAGYILSHIDSSFTAHTRSNQEMYAAAPTPTTHDQLRALIRCFKKWASEQLGVIQAPIDLAIPVSATAYSEAVKGFNNFRQSDKDKGDKYFTKFLSAVNNRQQGTREIQPESLLCFHLFDKASDLVQKHCVSEMRKEEAIFEARKAVSPLEARRPGEGFPQNFEMAKSTFKAKEKQIYTELLTTSNDEDEIEESNEQDNSSEQATTSLSLSS